MEEDRIRIDVLTPEGQALSVLASGFTLNTALGRMGVLHNHAPLAALVEPGPLVWKSENGEHRMDLGRGFLELENDRAVILVEQVVPE
ncbi:MAG: hypothetical protein IKD93_03230 [Firmicutes bacterium]|nr:hypothetical protein [Bacillota bacterium]